MVLVRLFGHDWLGYLFAADEAPAPWATFLDAIWMSEDDYRALLNDSAHRGPPWRAGACH
jgi:hypothetical protein